MSQGSRCVGWVGGWEASRWCPGQRCLVPGRWFMCHGVEEKGGRRPWVSAHKGCYPASLVRTCCAMLLAPLVDCDWMAAQALAKCCGAAR